MATYQEESRWQQQEARRRQLEAETRNLYAEKQKVLWITLAKSFAIVLALSILGAVVGGCIGVTFLKSSASYYSLRGATFGLITSWLVLGGWMLRSGWQARHESAANRAPEEAVAKRTMSSLQNRTYAIPSSDGSQSDLNLRTHLPTAKSPRLDSVLEHKLARTLSQIEAEVRQEGVLPIKQLRVKQDKALNQKVIAWSFVSRPEKDLDYKKARAIIDHHIGYLGLKTGPGGLTEDEDGSELWFWDIEIKTVAANSIGIEWTASSGEVVRFKRNLSKQFPSPGATKTYEEWMAPSSLAANEYLNTRTITERNKYVVVETPNGTWGKDIGGPYLEECSSGSVFGTTAPDRLWLSTDMYFDCPKCGHSERLNNQNRRGVLGWPKDYPFQHKQTRVANAAV